MAVAGDADFCDIPASMMERSLLHSSRLSDSANFVGGPEHVRASREKNLFDGMLESQLR
jgi:hypothetical protein